VFATAIILSGQLDWLKYKHKREHQLRSLSLSHYHNLHDNASSVITTILVCFGGASMRCDLANRRNASRRRSWLLPGCAADELRVLARVGDLEESRFHYSSALERYDLANRENASR
jgi:hypothetical protein